MKRNSITTHALDTSRGKPASNLGVTLEIEHDGRWQTVASARTDKDGRIADLTPVNHSLEKAIYRLSFDVGAYFEAQNTASFYPSATITFRVDDPSQHYHVPLLVSPFGYSTYRGS